MRTIVVDDEPWMLKRFALECEGLADVTLLGSFKSPLKALDFANQNPVELAFLDIEMPELTGIELAHKLKEIDPKTIIVFVSAYDNYMTEAIRTKTADYYIMKPYNTGDLEAAVDRAKLLSGKRHKSLFARTFGPFELLSGNKPVAFQDSKSKELLALLVDRRGDVLPVKEAAELLWKRLSPGKGEINFYRALRHLNETVSELHLDGIIETTGTGTFTSGSGVFIHTDVMDCDMYQLLDGNPEAIRQYSGDYMAGYDWAAASRSKLCQRSSQTGSSQDVRSQNKLCAVIRTLDDPQRTFRYMNDVFLSMVGFTREEIESRFQNSFRALVAVESYARSEAAVKRLFEAGKAAEVQYRLIPKNDRDVWVLCKSKPPNPGGDGIPEISSTLIDVTETKAKQDQLEQAAHCDGLTKLLNRSFAQECIQQYLTSANPAPAGVLILMDVDNFKAVNDAYGRAFADTVLTDMAAILMRSIRCSDIVCRLGGDKIMAFLKGMDQEMVAQEKLKNILDVIHERLSAKTQNGEMSCSSGGAVCPQDGQDFETLCGHAELALNKAKEKRNCSVWFSEMKASDEDT